MWTRSWILRWLPLAALAAGTACSPPPSRVAGGDGARADVTLADGWRFTRMDVPGAEAPGFADAAWTPVTLPHAWNARDGQDGGNNYYRGAGWYRRQLALPAAYAGRSIVLQFDGASLVADVWVNGTHVGQHRGGFATFRFDVTPLVHPGGADVLAVKVSNAAFDDVPPLSGDFTIVGGLYRAVHVIATDALHVALDDRLVGRVRTTPRVSAASADVDVDVLLANGGHDAAEVDVAVTLLDGLGRSVADATAPQRCSRARAPPCRSRSRSPSRSCGTGAQIPISTPRRSRSASRAVAVDQVSQRFGVRSFALDPATGFSFNGRRWICTASTAIRTRRQRVGHLARRPGSGHGAYPRGRRHGGPPRALPARPIFPRSCRSEWPGRVDRAGDGQRGHHIRRVHANARQQLTELIRQGWNHPSIVFWGLGNEVVETHADPNPLLAELQAAGARRGPGAADHLRDSAGRRRRRQLAHGRDRVQQVLRVVRRRPVESGHVG